MCRQNHKRPLPAFFTLWPPQNSGGADGYKRLPRALSLLPGDASALWAAHPFEHVATLVDDVHFIIHLMHCKSGQQPCIFSEEVDFANGDDAQTWILIPLTADESENLRTQGEAVSIKEIETLTIGRRCLVVDYPSGGEKSCWWRDGPLGILRR